MSEIEFFTKADGVYSVFNDEHHIAIAKANRLLKERGTVVRSRGGEIWDALIEYPDHTRQGLLICVEPIVKPDTAESLLRAILKEHFADKFQTPLIDRARALLAKGGKDE